MSHSPWRQKQQRKWTANTRISPAVRSALAQNRMGDLDGRSVRLDPTPRQGSGQLLKGRFLQTQPVQVLPLTSTGTP